jgi:uncharacterized membrane protein
MHSAFQSSPTVEHELSQALGVVVLIKIVDVVVVVIVVVFVLVAVVVFRVEQKSTVSEPQGVQPGG